MTRATDAEVDRERLAALCEAALKELQAERTAAKPRDRPHIDDQIAMLREMLHWATSKH